MPGSRSGARKGMRKRLGTPPYMRCLFALADGVNSNL
jgi:hypothetical protein